MKIEDSITSVKQRGGNTRTRFIVNLCDYEVTRNTERDEIIGLHRVETIRGWLPGDNSVDYRYSRISLNSVRAKRVLARLIELEHAALATKLNSEAQ